ncbi:TPA: O-antigen ligase family protein [Bacillus luti]
MIAKDLKTSNNRSLELLEVTMIITYNITMLFYQMISKPIIIVIGLLWFVWFMERKGEGWSFLQKMIFLSCIYVPTSFVSILGTSYGSFPLTWYHLVIIISYIVIIFKGFHKGFYFYSPFIMLIIGITSLWTSVNIGDTLKQLLTLVLFIMSFFIGEHISQFTDEKFLRKLKFFYIISVFAFSLVIIIQTVCFNYLHFTVGYNEVIGQSRVVRAGLMNDYSFATLYIATGAILLVIEYVDKNTIKTWQFISFEVFFLISILLVNSRTGLFALLIVTGAYLLVKLIQGKVKSIFIVAGILIMIPYLIQYITASRGGQQILEGSGRSDLIQLALQVFFDNPLFGIGLGIANWSTLTGLVLPHNMIAQYLAQLGIIGSALFYLNFIVLVAKYLKYKSEFFWVLLTVLVGAMAIPDIVSSRFLSVIVMITIIASVNNKKKMIEGGINEKS